MYFNSDQNINFNFSEFFSDDFFSDVPDEDNPLDGLPCISLDKLDNNSNESSNNPSDSSTNCSQEYSLSNKVVLPPDKKLIESPNDQLKTPISIHEENLPNSSIPSEHQKAALSNTKPNFLPQQALTSRNQLQVSQAFFRNGCPQMSNSPCKLQGCPQFPPSNAFTRYSMAPYGCCSCFLTVGTISTCNHITSVDQMKAYLQRKISGNSEIRFNKATLHYLYNIFANAFNWGPLSRKEKRKKQYVFKRLYENKYQVVDFIQKYPSIIDQILLVKGLSRIKNSNQ